MTFDWDPIKDHINLEKHGVSFLIAQRAFLDENRRISIDKKHSNEAEQRYFCYGRIEDKILTVRFTLRGGKIRIMGAGFWREGKRKYEEKK